MLILRRKKDESILIGDSIRITIVECGSEGVRIAIDAPKQISILREELSKAEVVNKDALMPQSEYLHAIQTALLKRRPQQEDAVVASKNPDTKTTDKDLDAETANKNLDTGSTDKKPNPETTGHKKDKTTAAENES